MQTELELFHTNLCKVSCPEMVFGGLKGTKDEQLQQLKKIYRGFLLQFHSDKHPDPKENHIANDVSAMLNNFNAEAKKKIEQGIYGQFNKSAAKNPITVFQVGHIEYRIFQHLAEGDFSNVFLGESQSANGNVEEVCFKIVNDPEDSDLLGNEAKILRSIHHQSLQILLDHFVTADKKVISVFKYIPGYDFVTLREKFPTGVPQEHAVWMLDRLLSVLGYIHINKIVHGCIAPSNIMVVPNIHNALLLDFVFAIQNPQPTDKFEGHNDFSAPEVKSGKYPASQQSDIYALGKCMQYILGGDIATDEFPNHIDKRIVRFLSELLIKDPNHRSDDAWGLWHQLKKLRTEVFGAPSQFLPFNV